MMENGNELISIKVTTSQSRLSSSTPKIDSSPNNSLVDLNNGNKRTALMFKIGLLFYSTIAKKGVNK